MNTLWTRLRRYPRRLGSWLVEGATGHVTLLVNAGALAVAFGGEGPWHEDFVRVAGAVLQCIGIAGVVWGVLKTRSQFGLPSLTGAVAAYFRRFPRLSMPAIVGGVGAALGAATAQAQGYGLRPLDENPTLEQQLAYLMATVHDLKKEDAALRQLIDTKDSELKAALERERAARHVDSGQLRGLLTSHATGGLNVSLCGAIFLFVGVLLGTLPYSWF